MERIATYRVQLHAGFDFARAEKLVDYLRALGVSHLYVSPILQAGAGSTHGYDVVDPGRVNEELGGQTGFARLCRGLRQAGLGFVLDIVPNHMAIGATANPWWWDVLENGPASRYAGYFAVDWDLLEADRPNRILLPVLGDHYGRVLEAGELRLERDGGAFIVRYYDHRFPLAPRSLDTLLTAAATRCGSNLLAFIADSLGRLPSPHVKDLSAMVRRHRDKEILRLQLAELCARDAAVDAAVDATVREWNRDVEKLDLLLSRQSYRLAYWRMSEQEMDYRRFFDVDTLIGIRQEDEAVFAETHQLVLQWLGEGLLDGLRVDHVDGLRDPEGYLRRLSSEAPGTWLLVEKILEPGERLPASWPVAGTTGYDFAAEAGRLLIDESNAARFDSLYAAFAGEERPWDEVMREAKRQVLREVLGSDLHRLTSLLRLVCERHRRHRDYTRAQLQAAVAELIVRLPVYRTYVRADEGQVLPVDVETIRDTVDCLREARPDMDPALVDFLRDILLLRHDGELEAEFVQRFQQTTGPAMAKGIEDTALYRYNRLVALNEVGSDPGTFGGDVADFHAACVAAQRDWPERLLATSTHDTKRSEDVRARLSVLSEIPDAWGETVARWADRNARYKTDDMPDRNTEYLLYQTLVGAWPIERDRVSAYMRKAEREAKSSTSWLNPDEVFEAALDGFVDGILGDKTFRADLEAFVGSVRRAGQINALVLALLKLTAPGVPDLYQGTELWDLSLVDPDNRRPVDYAKRRKWLAAVRDAGPEGVLERMEDGWPKLWLTHKVLAFRRRVPEAFGPDGEYRPLMVRGPAARHAVGYTRGARVAVVVPRLTLALGGNWGDTAVELPAGEWTNVLTGETWEGHAPVGALLTRFPVALLEEG